MINRRYCDNSAVECCHCTVDAIATTACHKLSVTTCVTLVSAALLSAASRLGHKNGKIRVRNLRYGPSTLLIRAIHVYGICPLNLNEDQVVVPTPHLLPLLNVAEWGWVGPSLQECSSVLVKLRLMWVKQTTVCYHYSTTNVKTAGAGAGQMWGI